MTNRSMTKQDVIQHLQLEAHIEGGFYRRTFCSTHRTTGDGGRACMSSIFYLLTDDRRIGHLHCNRSDIVHYYQGIGVLRYTLIHPDGHIEQVVLGPDLAQGHRWQMTVGGGIWKASELLTGEWGLISEAVCPGFEFADMRLADLTVLQTLLPERWQHYQHLIRG